MPTATLTFILEQETKGAVRYKEQCPRNNKPGVGVLCFRKRWLKKQFNGVFPQQLEVLVFERSF